MVKAILFDADGVLVDSEYLSTRMVDRFGAAPGFSDEFFFGPFQKCLTGELDLKEEVAKVMHEWPWDGDLDSLLEYWFRPEDNRVDERFVPLIAALRERGVICALGTNNEKYRTHDLVHNKGIGKWMDKIFSSAHVGKKKPDPDFFAHISKDLQLKPEEIAFWDDDQKNVKAAKEHGMRAYHFVSFDEFMKDLAELDYGK